MKLLVKIVRDVQNPKWLFKNIDSKGFRFANLMSLQS